MTFLDPGLYPVELVYYQNGSSGYLEWSHTTTVVPECPNDICGTPLTDPSYNRAFALIAREELYSSRVGSNPGCQECGAAGMPPCSTGNYCGDGLCQACVTPDHCGPSCVTCPADRYLCQAGQCVQCVADDQCPDGQTCDTAKGTCLPSSGCSTDADCPRGQECTVDRFCYLPELPQPCTTNDPGMCPAGLVCDTVTKLCKRPPMMCNADGDCKSGYYYCDTAEHICKARRQLLYVGGQAGCSMGAGQGASGTATGVIALFGLALLGLVAHGRRRLAAAVDGSA